MLGLVDKLRKVQQETNDKLTSLIQESGSSLIVQDVEDDEEEEEDVEPAEKIPKLL